MTVRRILPTILLGSLAAASSALAGEAATLAPQFTKDIAPIFKANCVACHMTGTEPGKMSLAPSKAYANLVGVASQESAFMRVKAGSPETSYLLMKLSGTHLDHGGKGVRMPLGGAPLDEGVMKQLRRWIAEGALNN
jgi:hypothetical protein